MKDKFKHFEKGDCYLTEELLRMLQNENYPMFEFSNRDEALILTSKVDFETQLFAIKNVLRLNQKENERESAKTEEIRTSIQDAHGEYADYLVEMWVEHLQNSVFLDAAHSMSAVGMLAPFVESLFDWIFTGLREIQNQDLEQAANDRTLCSQNEFWDPRLVFHRKGRSKDIAQGVQQLADSIGLREYLPDDYGKTLSALFSYRNKIFHNGLEWPMEERENFEKLIQEKAWPLEWFPKSTSGGDPWIFYMSDSFIEHCLTKIDQVLEGVGKYVKKMNEAMRSN